MAIKEIWLLSEKESNEADRTVSEKNFYKYTGQVIKEKIPLIEITKKEDEQLVIEAAKEHKIVALTGPNYSAPKIKLTTL